MCSTAEAFLRAVIAHPDDDGPRLVFADWLDEHGEPDRAAFIRAQVAAADTPPTPPALRRAWAGAIDKLAYHYEFRRGFVEEAAFHAHHFVRHAEAAFDAAPLRLVRLLHLDSTRVAGELAGLPLLRRVHGLHLTDNALDDPMIEVLASYPHLAGLETLRLGLGSFDRNLTDRLTDRAARALAESPHLPGLTRLVLSGHVLTDEGALALARSPRLRQLRWLDVSGNRLTPAGAAAVAAEMARRGGAAGVDGQRDHRPGRAG